MDIPAILARIRPGAAWRMAGTYDQLVATWDDEAQSCPTLEELEAAWPAVQADIASSQNNVPTRVWRNRLSWEQQAAVSQWAAANDPQLMGWLVAMQGWDAVDVSDVQLPTMLDRLVTAGVLTTEQTAALLAPAGQGA